ncbi:unnamed protein product [Cuscuta europaea]|uniref:Uncharacterized protein n=1 Tax=Cuscuta europaea TaxID=41803 RepID=A0A9P0YR94_CUSEU|nr:unnamed protein product [Cuscuta europaea]
MEILSNPRERIHGHFEDNRFCQIPRDSTLGTVDFYGFQQSEGNFNNPLKSHGILSFEHLYSHVWYHEIRKKSQHIRGLIFSQENTCLDIARNFVRDCLFAMQISSSPRK